MEKTTRYALYCLDVVLQGLDWTNIENLICWSDGPSQFKSAAYLGTICKEYMWRHTIKRCDVNFGAQKHWKGPWDRMLGTLGHVFKNAWMQKPLETLEDVAVVYREWGEEEMRQHPGTRFRIVHLDDPVEKTSLPYCRLNARSLFGIASSYAMSFRVNDKRCLGAGSFAGKGGMDKRISSTSPIETWA